MQALVRMKTKNFPSILISFHQTMWCLVRSYKLSSGYIVSSSIMHIKIQENQPRKEKYWEECKWVISETEYKEELKDRAKENVENSAETYREVFSDVGDLCLGFLGNPKAPNFCQSFLHFCLSLPSPLLSQSHTDERRRSWSSFFTKNSLSLSISIWDTGCVTDSQVTTHKTARHNAVSTNVK